MGEIVGKGAGAGAGAGDDPASFSPASLSPPASPPASAPASVGDMEAACGASAVEPVALSWHALSLKVRERGGAKNIKVVVQPCSGVVEPGQLLAVMGPSGSGKTSLCEMLAGRIASSKTEGCVLANGQPLTQERRRAIMSYVAQEDTLMGQFSVLETLRTAARFVHGYSLSRAAFEACVREAVVRMGLVSCQDTLVGDIFRKGISGGQKRRLSIAMELISQPSCLLLDEPTSGLDSASALAVVRLLRRLAVETRVTVITTIHQPSSEVWAQMDRLLLLSQGRTIYHGSAAHAPDYFALLGLPCPQYCNPADFIISLVNTDFADQQPEQKKADPSARADSFAASDACAQLVARVEAVAAAGRAAAEAERALTAQLAPRAAGTCSRNNGKKKHALADFVTLCQRQVLNNWRNPGIFWVRFAMYTMLAILIGVMYIGLGEDRTASGINSRAGMLFFVAAFLVFMSVAVLPFYIMERATFVREHLNGWYGTVPYLLSNLICAQPGLILISLVSSICVVCISGINGLGVYFLCLWFSLVMAESFMNLVSACVPHYIIGIALAAGFFGFCMLCEGFFIVRADIPPWLIWGYYIAPHTYSFRTFMFNEFASIPAFNTTGGVKTGLQVLEFYGMSDVVVWQDLLTLLAFAALFQFAFWLVLHFKWSRPAR